MMVSDNGKTFKGKELKRFCTKNDIKWRFNLPLAPWWGGIFERMVKSTKRCKMKKIIGSSLLSYEELTTVLAEIETVLNNGPLTYLEENDIGTCVISAFWTKNNAYRASRQHTPQVEMRLRIDQNN